MKTKFISFVLSAVLFAFVANAQKPSYPKPELNWQIPSHQKLRQPLRNKEELMQSLFNNKLRNLHGPYFDLLSQKFRNPAPGLKNGMPPPFLNSKNSNGNCQLKTSDAAFSQEINASKSAKDLYGVTWLGGNFGGGTINKFIPCTNNLTVVKSLETFAAQPGYTNFIQASNGKLYGLTVSGGIGYGTILSFDPSSHSFAILKNFDNTDGGYPFGALMQATNGILYGMTGIGGSNDAGVIFSFDPESGTYTKLKDFDGPDGASPGGGSLIQASDGKLYGMTSSGGNSGAGVIFSFDISSSTYTKLKDFDFATDGGYPNGGLVQASDGKLYAVTSSGGSSTFGGVIFSFDISSSTYTKLKDFFDVDTDGFEPLGSLIEASDGKLYGMTAYGGSSGNGTIFSYDPSSSTYVKVKEFDGTNGANPFGGSLLRASNGKLYGMTELGGSKGYGVVFSFDISSSKITKLKDFNVTNGAEPYGSLIQASDGALYGMANGGKGFDGVIFSFYIPSSKYAKLKDLGSNKTGSYISASLTQTTDGKLYGMTYYGGKNGYGAIFSYDPGSATYTRLKDFDGLNGAFAGGSLVQATDGKLYGVAGGGSDFSIFSSGSGVIFSYDPSTDIYTKLMDFAGTTAAYPSGSLVQATDGKLYGMTQGGGSVGHGVIFSYDPATNIYTKLKDFDVGVIVWGSLMQAKNGKLYGMTTGAIFSFDPSTNTYTELKDFDGINGTGPMGNSLIQANNGMLYGMTTYGGSNDAGVIFSFHPSSNTYKKLVDFNIINGANPLGNLIQASDGKLYGMTYSGGNSNAGVIFSFDPSPHKYIKLQDFDYTNGANPYIGSGFIEIPKSNKAMPSIAAYAENSQQQVIDQKQHSNNLLVTALPNPSRSQFTLKFESSDTKEVLNLQVMDASGKMIEAKQGILPGSTLRIGSNYAAGIYFIEVTQRNYKTQLKLIKTIR